MYVCMYVCMMYVCTYVCMHACMHALQWENNCYNWVTQYTSNYPCLDYLVLFRCIMLRIGIKYCGISSHIQSKMFIFMSFQQHWFFLHMSHPFEWKIVCTLKMHRLLVCHRHNSFIFPYQRNSLMLNICGRVRKFVNFFSSCQSAQYLCESSYLSMWRHTWEVQTEICNSRSSHSFVQRSWKAPESVWFCWLCCFENLFHPDVTILRVSKHLILCMTCHHVLTNLQHSKGRPWVRL